VRNIEFGTPTFAAFEDLLIFSFFFIPHYLFEISIDKTIEA